jgi:hypothetical protein
MKTDTLTALNVDELIALYVDLCVEQDRDLLRGDVGSFNRRFDRIEEIEQELKSRPGDQRHALISLHQHENIQVRVTAAKATLAVAPVAARQALKDIKALNWHPQSAEASSSLWTLDRGIFKPT